MWRHSNARVRTSVSAIPWAQALAAILLNMAPAALAVQLPIRTYTTADGLPRDAAFCVVPDARGFLWLCTSEGLARFDGKGFELFGVSQGLPNPVVGAFIETKQGVMLAATNHGVARMDQAAAPGSPHQFLPIPTNDGKPPMRIEELFEDGAGTVWAGAVGGIYRLENPAGTARLDFTPLGSSALLVQSFAGDGGHGLWIGTNAGLCHRSPDGRMEWLKGGGSSPPREAVNAILFDNRRRLWVGTYSGLWLLEHGSAGFKVYGRKEGLASERIHSLFQALDGKVWVGTAAGLSEFQPEANRFRSYGSEEGLRGRTVFAINESKDGSLWVAVDHGLARVARSGFLRYTHADGMGDLGITAFVEDRGGHLYAISNEPGGPGLHRFDGARFRTIRPAYPVTLQGSGWGLEQIVLVDHTGEWWFATGEGLIRFPSVKAGELPYSKPKAFYTTKNGLASNAILRIFEDSAGRIWVSTLAGLSVWFRATGSFHQYSNTEVPGYASAFIEDRAGDVWIAASVEPGTGRQSKIFRFCDGQLRNVAAPGMPDSWISTLFLDHQGGLWIGSTEGGLSRVANPAAPQVTFTHYGVAEGMSSLSVGPITEDQWGRIYAATPHGIDRLDPATGRIRHYSSTDGLPASPIQAAHRDREGRLWFGTGMGLASFKPMAEPPREPATALVKAVTVNGKPRNARSARLELSPDEDQLQIQFAAPGAPNNEWLRFEYRLKDSGGPWSQPSLERTVNYSKLSPGRYRFQVRAVVTGEPAGAPAELGFTIQPHFWQRWWFRLLIASALLAVAFAWHRYDLQRRLEIEHVRTRLAGDLHDDLGANLTRVVILSEVAQRKTTSSDPEVGRRLIEIANVARGLADGMSDLVWSVDPRRDDMPSLLNRVREFSSDVLEPQGIAWSLHAAESIETIALSADRRWHLFLIVKEAINNAARHAHCSSVAISLAAANGCVSASIADNGCGLTDEDAADAGNGLVNMRKRAAALRGELRVHSTPGSGVQIELRFPFEGSLRRNRWAKRA